MENLEKKITANRVRFDDAEPEDGHFDRFRQKLNRISSPRKFTVPYYVRVAVVLLLVSVSSILVYELISSVRFHNRYSFGNLSPEYREVEDYYLHVIKVKYDHLQNLDINDHKQKQMILKELKEMDELYLNLSKELKNDPHNEMIINAMIKHYQIKLDIINDITDQLELLKNSAVNNKQHENTEI
jgi:hypothetical protein